MRDEGDKRYVRDLEKDRERFMTAETGVVARKRQNKRRVSPHVSQCHRSAQSLKTFIIMVSGRNSDRRELERQIQIGTAIDGNEVFKVLEAKETHQKFL